MPCGSSWVRVGSRVGKPGGGPVVKPLNLNYSKAKYARVGACLLRIVFKAEVQTWSESGGETFEFQCS